ncbi:protein kinase [Desulfovibrio sp. OttesenSCG-928-F20]|nr:protein kinase [Desulfovibrio sp. OttesenSCG-928-F20]
MGNGVHTVSNIVIAHTNLEAPRREGGKDSPVTGGGQTPPDKSLEARKTNQPRLLEIKTWMGGEKYLKSIGESKGLSSVSQDQKVTTGEPDNTLDEVEAALQEVLNPPKPKVRIDKSAMPKPTFDSKISEDLETDAALAAVKGRIVLDEVLEAANQQTSKVTKKTTSLLNWSPAELSFDAKDLPASAHTLMRKAAEADNLALELLMQRQYRLGGEFAAMTREQMAEAINDVPLAKLSAEDRMQLTGLRGKHRELMNIANSIIDSLESKDTAKAVKPELKRLSAALKTCEKRLSGLIKKTPVEDRAAWQSLLDRALAGTEIKMHDAQVEHLARNSSKTSTVGEAARRSIEGLFNSIAQMRQEEKALLQGGKTALATRVLGELGLSAQIQLRPGRGSDLLSNTSFMLGITLLKQCATIKESMNAANFTLGALTALSRQREPLLDILGARQTVRMTPKTDVSVQKMLSDIMPLPAKGVPAKQEEREINSLVWKFNNAMRFNVDKRLYMGLTPNMQSQFFSFAGKAPLSGDGKQKLYTRLTSAFASHFPDVPKELDSRSTIDSGKSKPQIVNMGGWDRPVLLKKVSDFNERIRELAYNSLMGDNPNVPKVLGVALPKDGSLASADARIIFETVPGKDLSAFVTGMNTAPKDSLLTSMSPLARAKAAVHLVSGAVRGLAPLHAMGFAHCDIKPANIMLHDKTLEPCLIDFGSMGRSGEYVAMTAGYVALDEYTASPAVDIFSLGRTLMELAYGQPVPGMSTLGFHDYIAKTSYWQENAEVGQILAAANILANKDPVKRPTMDQLLAIIEGRNEIPQATEQGGASKDDLEVLQGVFGPQGLFTDGQSEIASRLR